MEEEFRTITIGEHFSQSNRLTANDIDPNYRLSTESVMSLFQDAVAAYLTTKHLAAFDLQPEGKTWVIAEYSLEICTDMPIWREEVETVICPTEISTVKAYFDFEIRSHDGQTVVSGSSCWSIVDYETGHTFPLPELIDVKGESEVRHKRNKFPEVGDEAEGFPYLTNISDIDFNKHVNNISYLRIAMSFMPVEYAMTHSVKCLAVKFLRQSFVHEKLICRYEPQTSEPGTVTCSIVNGDNLEVCRMVIKMAESAIKKDIRTIVKR